MMWYDFSYNQEHGELFLFSTSYSSGDEHGLVLDWIHGNLYSDDTDTHTINVYSIAGKHQAKLTNLGSDPHILAIDPRNYQRFQQLLIET